MVEVFQCHCSSAEIVVEHRKKGLTIKYVFLAWFQFVLKSQFHCRVELSAFSGKMPAFASLLAGVQRIRFPVPIYNDYLITKYCSTFVWNEVQ